MVRVKVLEKIVNFDAKDFTEVTVKDLIDKINLIDDLKQRLQNGRLKYLDFVLESTRTLSFYGIKNDVEIEIEKHFDPYRHFEIKFTDAPDAILGENNGKLRALLSCGHAVDPNSLTAYCRSLIDQGNFKLTCPALVEGTKKCNKRWEYIEIRKIALLNESEIDFFERKLSELAAEEFVDYKECPNCRSFVEREDLTNLRVVCTMCRGLLEQTFEFCWQCQEEWTVRSQKASDTCGRGGCENQDLATLRKSIKVNLDHVRNLGLVPSIRACPACGKLAEHNKTACKNVICPRCKIQFCFACLQKTSICSKSSSSYGPCSSPIAPVQMRIPTWHRY